jgi:tetratricopeptide (TPR) repeat protein
MNRGFIPPKVATPPVQDAPRAVVIKVEPRPIARLLVLGTLLLLATVPGVIVYFALDRNDPPSFPPAQAFINPIDKPARKAPASRPSFKAFDPNQFYTSHVSINSPETESETLLALRKLVSAIENRDYRGVQELYDGARTLEEVKSLGALEGLPANVVSQMTLKAKTEIADYLFKDKTADSRDIEIRRIEPLGNPNELLIYTRAFEPESHREIFYRWWMKRSDATWKLFDRQSLEGFAPRDSRIMAISFAVFFAEPERSAISKSIRKLAVALDQGDTELIAQTLTRFEHLNFLAEYESSALANKGLLCSQTMPEQTIALYQQALSKHPDNPGVYSLLMYAFNRAGQYENAIVAANRYMDIVGPSARVCAEKGLSCELLHDRQGAIASYLAGLHCDPGSQRNHEGLARVQR